MNQKKRKSHQINYCLFTKRDAAEKYPETTRTSVMTDYEKILKIFRCGLEVDEIIYYSLRTILHSSPKGRKFTNQKNLLPSLKTKNSFSQHMGYLRKQVQTLMLFLMI